jgi:hypothetical protein
MRLTIPVALCFLLALPSLASATPPADGWIVWQSNRADSRAEVFRARADGSAVTRLTTTGGHVPMWAPDGRWISFIDDAATVVVIRPDGSETRRIVGGPQVVPFWLHDNSGLVVQIDSDYFLFDPETGERTLLFSIADFPAFAGSGASFLANGVTADNHYLVAGTSLYLNGYAGSNGLLSAGFSAVVVDLLHKDRVYWFGLGCWPFTPPAGDLVFHICADCPTHPDIVHMSLRDLETRASYGPEVAHEDADWGHEYNPRVSNDNRWLVYMATTGCHEGPDCDYDIFLHEIGKGPDERTHIVQDPSGDGYPSMYVGPFWQPTSQPRLLVTPNRLTFYASASAPVQPQTVKIKNSGGGTLGPATLAGPDDAPWLTATMENDTVTVGLQDLSVLARGRYQTAITIHVTGAQGSPVRIPIVLVADDSFPVSEAGVPDARVPEAEAGVPEAGLLESGETEGGPVAESESDAAVAAVGVAADAGSTSATGSPGPEKDDGCGCALGAPRRFAPTLAVLLAGAGLLLSRRRRR